MATIKYNFTAYDPRTLEGYSEREIRAEYSRLRSIARKRLERLEKSGYTKHGVYRTYRKVFKPLAEVRNLSELRYRLSDLRIFLGSEMSTVTGVKKVERKSLKTLHSHGYRFVTEKNMWAFYDFMNFIHAKQAGRLYDSDQVATVGQLMLAAGASPEEMRRDFAKWQVGGIEAERALRRGELQFGDEYAENRKTLASYRRRLNKAKRRG